MSIRYIYGSGKYVFFIMMSVFVVFDDHGDHDAVMLLFLKASQII